MPKQGVYNVAVVLDYLMAFLHCDLNALFFENVLTSFLTLLGIGG